MIAPAIAVAVAALSLTYADAEPREGATDDDRRSPRPAVFVHGFSGSGAQFQTQALRFASNGYPPELLNVLEYDSLFGVETREEVFERLDARIADLLEASGADGVDLLGHSLGTTMMQEYLNSDPDRAADVAHYVNLDGATADAPPGGVPTLAVWGRGDPARRIAGASNLYFTRQTHTEVVTSVDTFEQVYTFFTGEEPATTEVVPEEGDRLTLSGRAVIFPQNTGVQGGTLEVHEVNGATGARVDDEPAATFALDGDGSWGPFEGRPGGNYEFAIVREGAATHHLYLEPFVRSDHLVRLLTSVPDGGIGDLIEPSDRHASLTIVRYKEWWGDQGERSDALEINGLNVLNETNAPIDKRAIGVFAFDAGSDGVTDLTTPIPTLFALPFITGVDVFVPVSDPPTGTISVAARTRGSDRTELVNVPDWVSADHRISIHFNEYEG
jgi:pimeloyl-ACP methyl ester carboxylesterase